jgi:hypothetical protein
VDRDCVEIRRADGLVLWTLELEMGLCQLAAIDVHDVLIGLVIGDDAFQLLPCEIDLVAGHVAW